MRHHVVILAGLSAALLGLTTAGPPPALAAAFDGDWTVQVITEKGTCDRSYRYDVSVAQGRIVYLSNTSVSLQGTVAPNGAVRVGIRHLDDVASGSGHLAARTGSGGWRGTGKNGACSGHWKALRR